MSTSFQFLSLGAILQGNDEQFVRNAYRAMLGRTADSGGFANYLSRLSQGQSRIEVLTELRSSSEGGAYAAKVAGLDSAESMPELLAHQDHAFVSCAYQTLLLRPADADGFNRYVEELGNGKARLQILSDIQSSGEAQSLEAMAHELDNIAQGRQSVEFPAVESSEGSDDIPSVPGSLSRLIQGGDRYFIHGLYRVLLGRRADGEGLENYVAQLQTGVSRAHVLRGINCSEERNSRREMLRQIDSAIKSFHQQQRPRVGWMFALKHHKQDQTILEHRLSATEKQLLLANQNLTTRLDQMEKLLVKQAAKARVIKLNQLSPLARDIYFQIKNGLDEREQGEG